MKRVYSDSKPLKLEAVGNGNYLYHWDIIEEVVDRMVLASGQSDGMFEAEKRTRYSFYEVTIKGNPNYDKCVEAAIRATYTATEELALINKYNAFQMKIHDDESIVDEYKEFLSFVAGVKNMVRKDLTGSI